MTRCYRTIILLITLCAGGACAQTTLPAGARVLEDLAYVKDGSARQKLDLYLPAEAGTKVPVVIWIHGGGWSSGSKARPAALRLLERGYAVASVGYRFSNDATFPAQIHDVKAAVRWLRAHADEYGLDRDHFAAWGASAGGQLALLLGLGSGVGELEGDLGEHDNQSSAVQCVVDYFGTVEFRKPKEFPLNKNRTNLLGGTPEEKPQLAALATAITHVTPDDPPVIIFHGDADNTVTISHSQALLASLKSAGVDVRMVTLPGAPHGGDKFNTPEINAAVDEFLDRHLRPDRPKSNRPGDSE